MTDVEQRLRAFWSEFVQLMGEKLEVDSGDIQEMATKHGPIGWGVK